MADKAPNRAKPSNLNSSGDGQYGHPWFLLVDHPVSEAIEEGFFSTVAGNVRPGDSIRVARMKDGKLLEFRDLMVISSQRVPPAVDVRQLGPVFDFSDRIAEEPKPDPIMDAPETYVPESCEAMWKGPQRKWCVIGPTGTVYVSRLDNKELAVAIARGDSPLPPKLEEAA